MCLRTFRSNDLPLVAIADTLERGDLQDWQPLARAIRRDPWGDLADAVTRLIDAYPQYGTSPLWRAWIDRCRARGRDPIAAPPVTLAALRRGLGLTQAQVARRLRMTQSDVSKLERRENARLSTLQAYARALGRPPDSSHSTTAKPCERFNSHRDRTAVAVASRPARPLSHTIAGKMRWVAFDDIQSLTADRALLRLVAKCRQLMQVPRG